MKPYTTAHLDYESGQEDACFTLTRNDGYSQEVPASTFWNQNNFSNLEAIALDQCAGDILDIGAGAGRRSLELQKRNQKAWAMEILPECSEIMSRRGVNNVITADTFRWNERSFDTLLMMMNGIGMVGTLETLDHFLAPVLAPAKLRTYEVELDHITKPSST